MNSKQQVIPTIGQLIEGGYFAGVVRVDGQRFGVVVAPKESEFEGEWGEYGKKIDARSVGDGVANTQAMLDAGSPIAAKVRALDINDHQDWYIPSRDELELMYRNLKPTDAENWASFRDGENPSADPVGGLYTEEDPAQTTVAEFQEDGAQAMEPAWYWSSTQYSAGYAFVQVFSDGGQVDDAKYYAWRVRAVRRFLIN
jgi:hypothetical protein